MATLSLRMRDDLKAKAQELASQQGVSLNSYINATLAATVATSPVRNQKPRAARGSAGRLEKRP